MEALCNDIPMTDCILGEEASNTIHDDGLQVSSFAKIRHDLAAASASSSSDSSRHSPDMQPAFQTPVNNTTISLMPHHHHNNSKSFVEEYVRCYALSLPPPKLTRPLLWTPPRSTLARRRRASSSPSSSSSSARKKGMMVRGGGGGFKSPPISLSHLTAPPLTAKECLLLSSSRSSRSKAKYKPYHSLDDPSTLDLLGDRKRYRPLLCCHFRHHHHDNNNNSNSGNADADSCGCRCCYSITTVQTPTPYVGETIPMTIVVAHYDHHHNTSRRLRRRHRGGSGQDLEYLKRRLIRTCRSCSCYYHQQQQQHVVELQRSQTGRLA